MRTRIVSLSLAAALLAAPTFVGSTASAQTPQELNKARATYKQGLSLEAAGDWGGALAKFEAVAKVKFTPQVRFHIARCKENLGRLNEALGDYRVAEYEAEQASASELPEIAKARQALEARIPKLVIVRGEGAESARIELDGVELGEAKVGREVSVDPGPHRIVVRVPKGQFEENVTVAEGEVKEVSLVAPDDLSPAETSGVTTPPPEEPPATVDVKPSGSALPWIIGGVGVASLAASGFFFLQKNAAEKDLEDVCRNDVCPRSKQSLQDDGERAALLTNVTLGVGVVGIGVATVMLISQGGKKDSAAETARNVNVNVGASRAFSGVTLGGHF
jgi:hypothetical protein